jgi:hypothetical protein
MRYHELLMITEAEALSLNVAVYRSAVNAFTEAASQYSGSAGGAAAATRMIQARLQKVMRDIVKANGGWLQRNIARTPTVEIRLRTDASSLADLTTTTDTKTKAVVADIAIQSFQAAQEDKAEMTEQAHHFGKRIAHEFVHVVQLLQQNLPPAMKSDDYYSSEHEVQAYAQEIAHGVLHVLGKGGNITDLDSTNVLKSLPSLVANQELMCKLSPEYEQYLHNGNTDALHRVTQEVLRLLNGYFSTKR